MKPFFNKTIFFTGLLILVCFSVQAQSDSLRWFVSGFGYHSSVVSDMGMSPLAYNGSGVSGILGFEFRNSAVEQEVRTRFTYGRLTNAYGSRLILLDGGVKYQWKGRLEWNTAVKWSWYLGGQVSTQLSSRERVGYSNSARRVDLYTAISPLLQTRYSTEWLGRSIEFSGQIACSVFGMILRPDYATSTPKGFHDERLSEWKGFWESAAFATVNRWVRLETEFELIFYLPNSNALGLRYGWMYGFYDDAPSNRLEWGTHQVGFSTKFSF